MITLLRYPKSLLPQFFMIVFFAANALYSMDRFSADWWAVAGLCLALGILVFFWPVRRAYVMPYLAAGGALILALTYFDGVFVFLGFVYSVQVGFLMDTRPFFIWLAGFSVLVEAMFFYRFGTAAALFSGLGPLIGVVSFGYAYHTRDRLEEAHRKTQQVLSELREAHARLEEYAGQVDSLARNEERSRLARDLHDSVKQQAFAAAAQIGAARSLLERDPSAARERLDKAGQLMDEIRAELSQLIQELRPVALQGKGLGEALHEWGAAWSQGSGIQLRVQAQGERRLPLDTEQTLFRIAQEALANVARHSLSATAEVHLEVGQDSLRMSIRDQGQGFDPSQPEGGLGIRSMRERAEQLKDGSLEIRSAPGQGTEICVRCAL